MLKLPIERPSRICTILDALYPNPPVPLNHFSAFTFIVSVVLSAQTTDGKVNDATIKLFQEAPTPEMMAELSPLHVQSIIQSVGLAPRKAEYIVELAKRLRDVYGSRVPGTYKDLQSLSGVGRKTASVVRSQLFGVPSFAVDTHVHRLALRWGLSKDEKNVDRVQYDLCEAFPRHTWNKLHLQMIYLGREYCTAKAHQVSSCPVCFALRPSATDEIDLSSFSPQKAGKGLITYHDRIQELLEHPERVLPDGTAIDIIPLVEDENDPENNAIVPSTSRKRTQKIKQEVTEIDTSDVSPVIKQSKIKAKKEIKQEAVVSSSPYFNKTPEIINQQTPSQRRSPRFKIKDTDE